MRPETLFDRADADWPLFGLVDDVRPALAAILEGARPGALATLVAVDGPSPRPVGAQMAIAPDGKAAGGVSGGCVEGSVAIIGREVASQGAPRLVVFGAGSPYLDIKLVCGSRIEVFIERAAPEDETLRAVVEAREARRSMVRTVTRAGCAAVEPPDRRRGALAGVEGDVVWRRYDPPTRLMIFGGDPVALATAQLGLAAGMETILVRRLGPQSAPVNIADDYLAMAPDDALAETPPDAWTAIVTTTHDLDEDHECLERALPSPAFYVGALGSRRRLADRIAKLERAGLPWDAIRRLRAPVGMDIGAATPMEIALSILAEIVCAQRRAGA